MNARQNVLGPIGYGILWVLSAAVLLFLLTPSIVVAGMSFFSDEFFRPNLDQAGWRWYRQVFADDSWWHALWNSLIVGSGSALLATVLGTLSAIAVWRTPSKLAVAVMAACVSPMIVPIIITAVGMLYFYSKLGLVNSLTGMVVAHAVLGIPFVSIAVLARLVRFDRNLVKAAQSLGASAVRIYFRITLPIVLPGILTGALFAFATSWDEVVAVIFLASPDQHTLPRKMWSGMRESVSPALLAVSTLLTVVSCLAVLCSMLTKQRQTTRLAISASKANKPGAA